MVACDKKNLDVTFVDEVETENRSINGLVKKELFAGRKWLNNRDLLITQIQSIIK